MSLPEIYEQATRLPPRVTFQCARCEAVVTRKRSDVLKAVAKKVSGLYCGVACYRETAPARAIPCSCAHCGKTFSLPGYEYDKKRRKGITNLYCSRICMASGFAVQNARRCRTCGEKMIREHNRWYCSDQCRTIGRSASKAGTQLKATSTCPECGETFHQKSSRTVYCGRPCADRAHSKRMTGPGNSRYTTGKSYANWFRAMRPLILDREGNRCMLCGQTPPPLRYMRNGKPAQRSQMLVHHINEDPADNRAENLVALCVFCHAKHHHHEPIPSSVFERYTESATRSMTSKWRGTATSLQARYSSTTAG